MKKELKFTCPNCGKNELSEVVSGILAWNTIALIDLEAEDVDDSLIFVGETSYNEDGPYIDSFRCNHCGYEIKDKEDFNIVEVEKLSLWLKENCPEFDCNGMPNG